MGSFQALKEVSFFQLSAFSNVVQVDVGVSLVSKLSGEGGDGQKSILVEWWVVCIYKAKTLSLLYSSLNYSFVYYVPQVYVKGVIKSFISFFWYAIPEPWVSIYV